MGPRRPNPVHRFRRSGRHRDDDRRIPPGHRRRVGKGDAGHEAGIHRGLRRPRQRQRRRLLSPWAALGGFGIILAVALRHSQHFSNTMAWISAASGLALIGAIIVGIGFHVPAAFVLLILGLLLSYLVIVALSLKVWRLTTGQLEVPLLAEPVS